MKKLEINLDVFSELTQEDCQKIEGGSEFSEGVFHTLGRFFGYAYAFSKGAYEGSQTGGGIFYK